MWKLVISALLCVCLVLLHSDVAAQCSVCTKTAQQLGEGPAKALNSGILYLMITPFAAIGFIIYRWIKYNNNQDA